MKKCIIIGGGLGGLSTGVILSRSGYEVIVLEQSNQIGGCLQCFKRGNAKFETGMHIVGSLDKGQVLSHYFNYLGITNRLEFERLDTQAYDIVKMRGESFSFPNGRQASIDYLSSLFPKERDNLVRYWQLVDKIAETTPYYHLNDNRHFSSIYVPQSNYCINDVLDTLFQDSLLKEVLMGNTYLYAAQRNRTPFSLHALVNDFYNRSAFRIVGGSDSIAKVCVDVIVKHGGIVKNNSCVKRVVCKDGKAVAVVLDDGEVVMGDIFVSSIHPALMTDLFVDKELRSSYVQRIHSIPNTTSVFALHFQFRPNAVSYLNSNYFVCKDGGPWDLDEYSENTWPKGYFYMHGCHARNNQYAETGTILSYMSATELDSWSDSKVGRRGVDYEKFKRLKAAKLLSIVDKDFPGLSSCIDNLYIATPLTFRDYTLTPGGSMYGMAKDISMGISGRVSYKTRIPNFFLVGQSIKAHGILGVLAGMIDVCSAILGQDEVRRSMLERNASTAPTPPISQKRKTLIMGGGLGGLVCGALLAKEGQQVTVLEKNNIAGGGLCCFQRHGVKYPTGMHFFGGFQLGGQLLRLCNYLGIMDKLHFVRWDVDSYDEVVCLKDNRKYRLPKGREACMDFLCKTFPADIAEIQNYFSSIYRLAEEMDLFWLRPTSRRISDHSEEFFWPADRFIAHYISNPELRELFSSVISEYAGVANESPAYMHALVSVSHLEGTMQFAGGSQQLADALVAVIEAHGGSVLCGEEVKSFSVQNHRLSHVTTKSGKNYSSDTFISDIPITELIRMAPHGAFPSFFCRRIMGAANTYSAFKVYIRIEDGKVPFTHSSTFCSNGGGDVWNQFEGGETTWPQFMYFVAHPDSEFRYTQAITIVSPMPFDWVLPWENTTVGHRGEDYLKWKKSKSNLLIDFLEKVEPGIKNNIIGVDASSPLTIRDYLGNKNGSMFGLHRDCNNIMQSYLVVNTKVENLFLTGQDIYFWGLCGVAMSAIETTEAVMGDPNIRTRILHTVV